ncbi:MAG: P-loop NTPase fold protein [Planctomycetaceae bacterium]
MTIEELQDLIKNGESETVAFFSDFDSPNILPTACAFANTSGGHLVFGVAERMPPYGTSSRFRVDGLSRTMHDRMDKYAKSLVPPVPSEEESVEISNGKSVYVVKIGRYVGNSPVSIPDGTVFHREADKNVSFEFKPKTGAEFERQKIIRAILADDASVVEAAKLSERTGLSVDRVSGHLEWLASKKGIGRLSKYRDGNVLVVTDADRIELEELVNAAFTADPAKSKRADPIIEKTIKVKQSKAERQLFDIEDSPDDPKSRKFASQIGRRLDVSREAAADEQCLRADEYANVIAAFFSETPGDVCFGLFGHWGRGKTYLMDKVCEFLAIRHQYAIVKFSAWKFRTNPELWAHLHETFATTALEWNDGSSRCRFLRRLVIPFRTALSRYGIGALIGSHLFFGLSLFPSTDKLRVIQFGIELLGVFGFCYLIFVLLHLQRLFQSFHAIYGRMPKHGSHLGLQATIGNDLKALLIGWLPKDQWRFASAKEFILRARKLTTITLLKVILYAVAVAFGSFALFRSGLYIAYILSPIWFLLWMGIPFISLVFMKAPKKILLVVDDLDRCEPHQMLEVIESVMLLLDDAVIRQRLQIAMLVEEEAVEAALKIKYKHLWGDSFSAASSNTNAVSPDRTPVLPKVELINQIIAENLEKIFLAFLRLPKVLEDDLQEIFLKYMKVSPSDLETAMEQLKRNEADGEHQDVPFQKQSNLATFLDKSLKKMRGAEGPSTSIEPDMVLSLDEKLIIWERVLELQRETSNPSRWGPRAVRCFLHKYRLARALIIEVTKEIPDPNEVVRLLLGGEITGKTEDGHTIGLSPIEYVCSQVK